LAETTATRTTTRFAGHDCVRLENEALALWVTRSVGPRIIGLALPGGDNLLAELPDEAAVQELVDQLELTKGGTPT